LPCATTLKPRSALHKQVERIGAGKKLGKIKAAEMSLLSEAELMQQLQDKAQMRQERKNVAEPKAGYTVTKKDD
jgi:hypothetical protein